MTARTPFAKTRARPFSRQTGLEMRTGRLASHCAFRKLDGIVARKTRYRRI
jgi:hypothetical protein